jgi:hypothetical protein
MLFSSHSYSMLRPYITQKVWMGKSRF